MSEPHQLKTPKREKEIGKVPSEGSQGFRGEATTSRTKDSVSTVSDSADARMTVTMENTYQLGPCKRMTVPAVTDILKDVLTAYLQMEEYEVEWSRKMTKTISEVIKSRVKELLIPRYKIVVQVTIGQLTGGIQISSRCLWDASNDTFASYSFKNSSLFGLATVYAVYFE
ncbi:dynein light chain Tctex-type 5-B-like [Pungitius pungitius]|uniref:dynein light chain Tctex-type 5-B-like n=1 Tax=Pungitius pungitius TaxID=134920 RepID=UPI002E110328